MRYECIKCGGKFNWIDPLDPQKGILAEAARICPACRDETIKRNRKKAASRRRWRMSRRMK